MTINIESMRAMVERMGPDQLRQFARMHSNDAIAMSLVSSRLTELNRAKASQQAQQTPAQPPKVVEQVAQSIPMEESGIAALPVQNMAMADGGIVGYSGADEDEGQLITDPTGAISSSKGVGDGSSLSWPSASKMWEAIGLGNPKNRKTLEDIQDFKKRQKEGKLTDEEKRRLGIAVEKTQVTEKPSAGSTTSASKPQSQGNTQIPMSPELRAALMRDAQEQGITNPTFNFQGPRGGLATLAASQPSSQSQTPSSQAPSQAPTESAPTTQSVIDQYKAMQAAIGEPRYGDVTKAQTAANELSKKTAEENKAAVEKYWSERGDQFKGKEGRITEREAALEKTKSSLEGMAWIQAGLETMSTAGSLGQAIAAGGKKGLSTYASGIEQYNMAKEKLDEARDKMEELRANQKDMSAKEIMAANRDINNVVAQNQQSMVAILREQAKNGDQKAADLLKIYDEQIRRKQEGDIKRAEIASRENEGAADRASREKIARMNMAALSERATLPKPITLDQASDNVSKFLDSMQGMIYISQVQKAAKESGKPVPDVYAIKKELIAKEMAGPAAAAPPTAPTMDANRASQFKVIR